MYASQVICLFLGLALFHGGQGSRFCTDDGDCKDLGDLYCIKSKCNWGVCGCNRGKAAHYLGSERLFQCVPLKKNGESCSLDDDEGLCGAPNSRCQEGTCKCVDNYASVWGGESCEHNSGQTTPGDTCTPASNALGSCSSSGNQNGCKNTFDTAMVNTAPVCSCRNGYKTVLLNALATTYFLGKKRPTCQPIRIDEKCKNDHDCSSIGGYGAKCDTGTYTCKCRTTGHVPSYDKLACRLPIAKGQACAGSGSPGSSKHCDGTVGLVCGDVCRLDTTSLVTTYCKCGASHTDNGGSCVAKAVGDSCYGDDNCKAYSDNGICVDGSCASGAGHLTAAAVLMVIPLVNLLYSLLA